MKDLIKFVPLVQSWPWPKLGFLLVLALLFKQVVTFEQSLILILLAVVIGEIRGPKASAALAMRHAEQKTTGRRQEEKKTKAKRNS